MSFSSSSSGKINSYLWNFDDGSTSTAKNPGSHGFGSDPFYTVTLKVTGPGGTDIDTQKITVPC